MLDVIARGRFDKSDLTNGTLDAAIQLTGGYSSYSDLHHVNEAKEIFRINNDLSRELNKLDVQKKIIENLKKLNIAEWIVDNFYIDYNGKEKKIIWNEDNTSFKIQGKPRYYVHIGDRLILHGFFPSPD
jgi:hypothetical protein